LYDQDSARGAAPVVDPPRTLSLRRNMAFAVGGMGAFHACQLGVIIVLAKFAPPEVLGQVQFSLAVATPILMFCSLELRAALVADAGGKFTFGTYRTLRATTSGLAAAVLGGVAVWEYVAEGSAAFALILAGMVAGKLVLAQAEIDWGLFQKRERLDWLAASAALRGVTMLAAFAAFVPLYSFLSRRGLVTPERLVHGAVLAVGVHVLASVVILVGFDRPRVIARLDYDASWTWAAVRRLARQTLPLGLVLLLLHLCNSVPQLFLERQDGGKAALGHFSALFNLTMAGNLLVFQAANAAAHRLATYYQTELGRFLRLAGKLLGVAAVVGVVSLVIALTVGRWLLRVLYRPDYADHYDEFKLIVLAQALALLTSVLGVLTIQMRLFWLQVPVQLVILLTTTLAAAWLIPHAENLVRGGALTVVVRAVVHAALYGGCVLIGILLRPRLLARGAAAGKVPLVPTPQTDDALQEW